MPLEPPRSPWVFPAIDGGPFADGDTEPGSDPSSDPGTDPGTDAGGSTGGLDDEDPDTDVVCVGADLAPGTLLTAYRSGLFPMGLPGTSEMGWWSPDPRGILPLDALRVSRSLRQSARHLEIRVDTAFAAVVAGCADPRRPGSWIDQPIAAAYVRLHLAGWAHSVEAWRDDELVGGLYGVAIGGLFAGESMFSRARDASKAALVGLVDLLRDEWADERLLDTQWQTPHLATLGVVEVSRPDYLRRLDRALSLPLPEAFDDGR